MTATSRINPAPMLAILMSLLVVLGSHRQAMGHGGADATEMVLCTGTGAVTVWLDANGDPTAPPHDCPDCIPGLPHALLTATPGATPDFVTRRAARLRGAPLDLSRPAPRPAARGPPLPV